MQQGFMLRLEQNIVENILDKLDREGYLFPQFELYKVNHELQRLGHGGFSVIYEMVNKERPYLHFALKVIGFEKHVVTSEDFWNTVRYQAILCQESSHIVRLLEAKEMELSSDETGMDRGIHLQFILMEKLEDILVKDRFKRASLTRNVLAQEREVLNFAIQIGQALMISHRNSILHRDIKLENIFWDAGEQIYKLGDFGIAKYVEEGNAETIVYTDGYGAPEIERQLNDRYNAAADIYSLGITLYLLLNELKFPGSEGYYAKAEVQYHPDFIFPAPQKASVEMTRIIRKMCSYNVEDRYQSMAEVMMEFIELSKKSGMEESPEFSDLEDLVTETYCEEKEKPPFSEEEKGERPRTRAERKEEREIVNTLYWQDSIKYLVILTVLLTILFQSFHVDTSVIKSWRFWVLPAAVFLEAVFQKIKELHVFWGILIIIFAGFSIYNFGVTLPHVVLVLCVLSGRAVFSMAGALGAGIWMFLEISGKFGFLDYLERFHLKWIFVILVILVAGRFYEMRSYWKKELSENEAHMEENDLGNRVVTGEEVMNDMQMDQ